MALIGTLHGVTMENASPLAGNSVVAGRLHARPASGIGGIKLDA